MSVLYYYLPLKYRNNGRKLSLYLRLRNESNNPILRETHNIVQVNASIVRLNKEISLRIPAYVPSPTYSYSAYVNWAGAFVLSGVVYY